MTAHRKPASKIKRIVLSVLRLGALLTFSEARACDQELSSTWFSAPHILHSDFIERGQASQFVSGFFECVEDYIFDPLYKRSELQKVRASLLAEVARNKALQREHLDTLLARGLARVGISHLASIPPEQSRRLIDSATAQPKTSAISVKLDLNGIAVLKVRSFLVPIITRDQVTRAMEQIKASRILIIDLRGNGGGSFSSVSYLTEHFLGPNVRLFTARTRGGLGLLDLHGVDGYASDSVNRGSQNDLEVLSRHGFIEWRTSRMASSPIQRSVYLLTDSACQSSCEIFVTAMREHKAASIIGAKTAGNVLAASAFRGFMPGYLILLPIAKLLSPSGQSYEGRGIAPDFEISECSFSNDVKEDECLGRAIDRVRIRERSIAEKKG